MPEILWVNKIYDDGWHNMNTHLSYWRGVYYVCFRSGASHRSPEGKIVLLASEDLEHWERVSVPVNTIGDDRDPHMVATPDRLYIYFATWMIREGEKVDTGKVPLRDLWSFCCSTEDGKRWSRPSRIYKRNNFFWIPILVNNRYYCVSYLGGSLPEEREKWSVDFLQSDDGLNWEHVATILDHGTPNETAIYMKPNGIIQAVIRAETDKVASFMAESRPPYIKWKVWEIETVIQSPEILKLGDEFYVAGRNSVLDPGNPESINARTCIWRINENDVEPLIALPSGGDTAYPGMLAIDHNRILISYYSQHEVINSPNYQILASPSHIYLACVRV